METIEHNEKTFVKATALAKKHRYTTDYIGQLCRSGKVEARLVGRAWFVNEQSLQTHKGDRYTSARPSEIIINKALVSENESTPIKIRREVRPVLSKGAHRSVTEKAAPRSYNFQERGMQLTSTYHSDLEALEPKLARVEVAKKAEIEEESQKIKVSLGEKAVSKLSFEELPEILLRGDLHIDSLDDPELFTDVEPVTIENISFIPKSVLEKAELPAKSARIEPESHKVAISTVKTAPVLHNSKIEHNQNLQIKSAPVIPASQVVPTTGVRFIVVPVFGLAAIVLCVMMMGLSGYVETDGTGFNQSLIFSVANVIDSMQKLPESY